MITASTLLYRDSGGGRTVVVPAQHGLRPDQDEMALPVPVEVADEEPEELVPAAKAGPAMATESYLKLLA
jgi:hypothetical protein